MKNLSGFFRHLAIPAAFLAGFAAGMIWPRGGERDPDRPSSPTDRGSELGSQPAKAVAVAPEAEPGLSGDAPGRDPAPKAAGALQEEETSRRARLAQTARRIYEALRQANEDPYGNHEGLLEIMGKIDELDESCAKIFIDTYLERLGKKEHDSVALQLAMACGGRDVSDFLAKRLNAADLGEQERGNLAGLLGGMSQSATAFSKIPVDGDLLQTAFSYARMLDVDSRVMGAGLLGGRNTPESRTLLLEISATDADFRVRAAAVRSLERVGDRDTLEALRQLYESSAHERSDDPSRGRFLNALYHTLLNLSKRLADH